MTGKPKHFGVYFTVLGVFALAAGCSHSSPYRPVAVEQRPWTEPGVNGTEFVTEHFDIRTDIQDELLRQYLPAFMETAFAEYVRLVPPAKPDADRLAIYLFETRDEWARFTRRFAPTQADTYLHIHAGGYSDYRTATSVVFDLGRGRTLSLLAHEGMHQYAARYLPLPLPPWLNEGLACQFEAFTLEGDRPTFTPRRNLLRLDGLREALTVGNELIPMQDLLRMDAGEAVRKTGQSTRVYYSQLWSTVLYLREPGTPYSAGFRSLLADAGKPQLMTAVHAYRAATPGSDGLSDAEVAFMHYVTPDLDRFTADYREFAKGLVH